MIPESIPKLIPDYWPHRAHSRMVRAAGLRWHVQVMGNGPALLLIHGTGAASLSWRDVMPTLAQNHTVIVPDLPGHGLTETPAAARMSLPGMARALQGLLQIMDVRPLAAAGHSAGAAILARMSLDGALPGAPLVSFNGAFLPLAGVAGQIFSPLARVLAGLPGLPQAFAWQAGRAGTVERLLEGTGSTLDRAGVALYQELVRMPGHAAAALAMMANWNLQPLVEGLPRLAVPLHLVVGTADRSVPPSQSARVQGLAPGATLTQMPGLGHLAHEERPDEAAAFIQSHVAVSAL